MAAKPEIHYRLAEKSDENQITEFLITHFITNEPLTKSLGCTVDDCLDTMKQNSIHALGDPALSFLAMNSKEEIVGVRLSMPLHMDKPAGQTSNYPDTKFAQVLKYMDVLDSGFELLIPHNCKRIVKFIILSVDPSYHRLGIATELTKLSLQRAKDMGFQAVIAQATATASQKLFAKNGFDILKILHHKYYLDNNGEPVFNCKDGTDKGELVFRLV